MTRPDAAVAERLEAWRMRLTASRARLLEALRDVTERDFAQALGEQTVVQALAGLAPAERASMEGAARDAGVPTAEGPRGPAPTKALPPQVMHDLAGARYETLRLLEAAATTQPPPDRALLEAVDAAVEAVAQREEAMAERIEGRPGGPDPRDPMGGRPNDDVRFAGFGAPRPPNLVRIRKRP